MSAARSTCDRELNVGHWGKLEAFAPRRRTRASRRAIFGGSPQSNQDPGARFFHPRSGVPMADAGRTCFNCGRNNRLLRDAEGNRVVQPAPAKVPRLDEQKTEQPKR